MNAKKTLNKEIKHASYVPGLEISAEWCEY
jgi:hypothetical protein